MIVLPHDFCFCILCFCTEIGCRVETLQSMSKGKKIDRPWEEKPTSTPPIWTSSMSCGTKKTPVKFRVGRGKPPEDNGSEEERRRAAIEEYVRRNSNEQNHGKTYSFKYFGVSEGGKMVSFKHAQHSPLFSLYLNRETLNNIYTFRSLYIKWFRVSSL